MGRIRTIKPEFHSHEELSSLPAETHLLAAALVNYADDEGYFNANPVLVKAGTNPLRADRTKLEDQLAQLEGIGYIVVHRQGARCVGRIVKFEEHQRVSHAAPSKLRSKFEELQSNPESAAEPLRKSSGGTPETLRPELKGIEGKTALVERAFLFFCKSVGKDPAQYTLTAQRREKALLRVRERLKIHAGDLTVVQEELKQAIQNLAGSDYHRTNGYLDWTEQIFRSEEEFQKRLTWQKPEGVAHGTNRGGGTTLGNRKADDANGALARSIARDLAQDRAEDRAADDVPGPGGGAGRDSPGLVLEGVG